MILNLGISGLFRSCPDHCIHCWRQWVSICDTPCENKLSPKPYPALREICCHSQYASSIPITPFLIPHICSISRHLPYSNKPYTFYKSIKYVIGCSSTWKTFDVTTLPLKWLYMALIHPITHLGYHVG